VDASEMVINVFVKINIAIISLKSLTKGMKFYNHWLMNQHICYKETNYCYYMGGLFCNYFSG